MSALEFHPQRNSMNSWPTSASMGCTSLLLCSKTRILDGPNRYRACEAAGIEPSFTVYTGDVGLARPGLGGVEK